MNIDSAPQEMIIAHEQRLQDLGIEIPEDVTLAIHNEVDDSSAVWIPPGPFMMGSEDEEAWHTEKPVHEVHLDGFYMDIYPVTNAQYARFVEETGHRPPKGGWGRNKWKKKEPPEGFENNPVVFVSWQDAQNYCEWSGRRLPTEAEWEKAARGGFLGKKYPWGDTIDPTQANYGDEVGRTTPVGSYPPNGYGLYDMAGNTWEWCADWFEEGYYARSPSENPQGPEEGANKVLKGGSWHRDATSLRCSNHYRNAPKHKVNSIGFRCARDP